MAEESLCLTCFNAFKRKYIKESDPETILTKVECTIYPVKNMTFMVVQECSKYDEKKLTRKEWNCKQEENRDEPDKD